jgi:hypothetical protein
MSIVKQAAENIKRLLPVYRRTNKRNILDAIDGLVDLIIAEDERGTAHSSYYDPSDASISVLMELLTLPTMSTTDCRGIVPFHSDTTETIVVEPSDPD